jgi:hypothetical protein
LTFGLAAGSCTLSKSLFAQTSGVQVASLRDQLEKGLKARRPVEFRFIDRVVTMVNNNQLPITLVRSTFHWARKKARFRRYPFQYFERALRERARRLRIQI